MDNRTLGEMKEDHGEMFNGVIKKSSARTFVSIVYARAYRGAMLTNALKVLGIDVPGVFDLTVVDDQAAERLDQLLSQNKVVVENKRQGQDVPYWEAGLYIYKEGELVFFMSIILPEGDTFYVTSNIPEL